MDSNQLKLTDFVFNYSSSSSDDENEKLQLAVAINMYETQNLLIEEFLKEEAESSKKHGGSVKGRRTINRNRREGHDRLMADYFSQNPSYPPHLFRRRFRMSREVFLHILNSVHNHNRYFVQRSDACGVLGLSPFQKMTSAIRMLAYGCPADALDDNIRIGESTAIKSLKEFCKSVTEIFGAEYLRAPTEADTARLLAVGKARGFPGMLGSLDCMHWEWKNCPVAWQGQYIGHVRQPTIILEAVASYDLWIWHAFFGMPGSCNDLNVLDRSPLFENLAQGIAPPANYEINGHHYNMGYYLADGIYPSWATIVQTISSPQGAKKQHFATMQEAARKDVERAFGVLQARFSIIAGPARFWDEETLGRIMKTCIILHNMIVESERGEDQDTEYESASPRPTISREPSQDFQSFMARYQSIRNRDAYNQIRNDLIEHLWQRHGE